MVSKDNLVLFISLGLFTFISAIVIILYAIAAPPFTPYIYPDPRDWEKKEYIDWLIPEMDYTPYNGISRQGPMNDIYKIFPPPP